MFEKPSRPTLAPGTDPVEHTLDVIQWEKDRADRAEAALADLIADCRRKADAIFELCAKAQKEIQ